MAVARKDVFIPEVDLPASKVPRIATRAGIRDGLAELKIGPPSGVVMVCTTIEKTDNVARSVSYQLVQGNKKQILCVDARKLFRKAKPGHFITLRADFNLFSYEPNVNYSTWVKSDALETRFWSEWKGTVK